VETEAARSALRPTPLVRWPHAAGGRTALGRGCSVRSAATDAPLSPPADAARLLAALTQLGAQPISVVLAASAWRAWEPGDDAGVRGHRALALLIDEARVAGAAGCSAASPPREIWCLASADGTVGLRDAVRLLAAETTRRRSARPISLETVITLARKAERENILRESAAFLLAWAARRTLHDRDDPVAAASLAFEAAQIQEEIGSAVERAQTLLILTHCLLALGQVQEAADAAEAAHWAAQEAINGPSGRMRTGCKSSGWAESPSHPLECDAQAMQAWAGCLRALGDVKSAERLLDVAVASSARAISIGGSPALLASLLVDRGTWLVSSSAVDAGDAERALELAADACTLTDPGSPERRHARILSAHALLALGRRVEARSIVNHLMGPVLHQIGLLSRDGLDLLDRLAVLGREWRMDELDDAAEWATQVRSALGDSGTATKG
jgi:hypothetical protein